MTSPAASVFYTSSFVCVSAFMYLSTPFYNYYLGILFCLHLQFWTDSVVAQHSGMFMGFEDLEGDDDIREEFPCPFCSEYLDIVGLCCHIDEEHPIEARNGV